MSCPQCHSVEIDHDSSRGDSTCMSCGFILSQNLVVSEVGFSESASGQSTVVGQFVAAGQQKGLSSSANRHASGYGPPSREQTLANGRLAIQRLGSHMAILHSCIEAAFNIFKLAVQHNFIQGRRTTNVIAACLYLTCRRDNQPHMLIDFSDALQINLYVLGATFLKLIQTLHLDIPIQDPSLYLNRFAQQLELTNESGVDLSRTVTQTALRLLARMKRDWIHVGRRPSGICGACLLIACRMHGFKRTQKEIIRVVRICDVTLRKRLVEFVSGDSSELTFDEFESLGEEEQLKGKGRDPPSLIAARRKEQMEVERRQAEIDRQAEMQALGIVGPSIDQRIEEELAELLREEDFQQDTEAIHLEEGAGAAEIGGSQEVSLAARIAQQVGNAEEQVVMALKEAAPMPDANGPSSSTPSGVTSIPSSSTASPSFASTLPLPSFSSSHPSDPSSSSSTSTSTSTSTSLPESEYPDFSSIDDSELDCCFLSPSEIAFKQKVWESLHADWIKKQEEKKKLEGTHGHKARQNKNKKPRAAFGVGGFGSSVDATRMALQEKKVSSKINYSALEGLFNPTFPETKANQNATSSSSSSSSAGQKRKTAGVIGGVSGQGLDGLRGLEGLGGLGGGEMEEELEGLEEDLYAEEEDTSMALSARAALGGDYSNQEEEGYD